MKKTIFCTAFLVGGLLFATEFTVSNPLGWVFRTGETVTATGTGTITVSDFRGKKRSITATADGTFAIPTDVPGYFVLRQGENAQSFAVIPAPPAAGTEAFGINFHLTRVPLADAKREVALAQFIGYGWGRGMLFDWSDVKGDDYREVFTRYAALADFVKNCGMNAVGGIYYIPRYASGAPAAAGYSMYSRALPDDTSSATEFCREYARRCPFMKYWEIGNEPDADVFWRGRWKNLLIGNERAIIGDYVDFLAACSKGIKEGNPGAKVLYAGLTGGAPEGHTYRPFLAASFEFGAAGYYDLMNVHYTASLEDTRKVMAQFQVPQVPIWVTEIGGTSGGRGRTERTQIVDDLTQQIEQLAAGAEKVFKYDFRNDGTEPQETEHNFGMVKRDFSPKPNYPAVATLIRMLSGKKFTQELNVVRQSGKGFLKGYSFGPVSAFWINAAKEAEITLDTPDKELILTDVMGVEHKLIARKGKVRFSVDELPFFITGKITSAPGKPAYPADQLIRTIPVRLANPGFEAPGHTGWQPFFTKGIGKVSHIMEEVYSGTGALRIEIAAPGERGFRCLGQKFDVKPFLTKLKPDQYLRINFSCATRRIGVVGRGSTLTASFYNAENKRFGGKEDGYRSGSHDWRRIQLNSPVPAATSTIGIEYYIAPDTTGAFDLDDIQINLELWQRPQ